MQRSARFGSIALSAADAEDVTQEAMLRLVGEEERENSPPLTVRGLRSLRLAKVDHVRRHNRAKEPKLRVLRENEPEPSSLDAGIRLIELEDPIRREVGDDGLEAARARAAGETERELGSRPGWTPERAHAARRRLLRGTERLLEQLLDDD